jgi:serine protease inhibitor ecotin
MASPAAALAACPERRREQKIGAVFSAQADQQRANNELTLIQDYS